MNLWMIFLFSGIYGLQKNELTGINVIETLKAKNISCNLRAFIQSTSNLEDEYNILIHDLTTFCSTSKSTTPYRLLCHMILIELEIGCLLLNNSRPSPVKYSIPYTSAQICSMNKIALTNNWIWQKLTSDEKEQIGPTSIHLCPFLTSSNNTLRLTRFFYKIAPHIRRADAYNSTYLTNKDSPNSLFDKIKLVDKINNTNIGLFEQQDQLAIDKINKYSKLLNQTAEKTGNKTNKNENINASVDRKYGLQKEYNLDGRKQEQTLDEKQREQVNERPKPKVLDVGSAFKENNNEEKNSVEGKNNNDQLHININGLPQMKFENNPLIFSQSGRKKKSSFKSKLNRHFNDDDDDLSSNNFITTFLVFMLCILIIYLILHNKNKILGLIIEGCKQKPAVYRRRRTLFSQSS